MDTLLDSGSDEDCRDDTDRRLSSLVLRPAITSLPSIGDDDPESDDENSSNEAEVIFSNINWATEESTGLSLDPDLISPRPMTVAKVAGGRTPAQSSGQPSPAHRLVHAAGHAEGLGKAGDTAKSSGRAFPSSQSNEAAEHSRRGSATTLPTTTTTSTTAAAAATASPSWAADDDPDEPYEGRGWLAGAAGRLANVAERRRLKAADASDEEHVAAAARDAAALQLMLMDMQRAQLAGGAGPGPAAELGRSGGEPASGSPAEQAGEVRLQLRRQHEEQQEQRLLQDFHDTLEAAENEPPLVAPAGLHLILEAPVAGLGLDDLDALIARLTAGTADLGAGPSTSGEGGPAAAAAGVTGAAAAVAAAPAVGSGPGSEESGVRGGRRSGGALWSLDLPAAESLWSDEEEEPMRVQVLQRGRPGAGAAGQQEAGAGASGQLQGASGSLETAPVLSGRSAAGEWTAGTEHERALGPAPLLEPQSVAAATAQPGGARGPGGVGRSVLPAPSPPLAMPPSGLSTQPPPPHPPGPLPAKFKFFACPAPAPVPPLGSVPTAPPLVPPGSGADGAFAAPPGGGGPIKMDLRPSIVEAVQRNAQAVAAAAAQRESEAKAAAARRRLAAVGSDSDDDDEDDEEAAAARAAARRPPVPRGSAATATGTAPSAAPTAPPLPPAPASGQQQQPPAGPAPSAGAPVPLPHLSASQPAAARRGPRGGITDSAVTAISSGGAAPEGELAGAGGATGVQRTSLQSGPTGATDTARSAGSDESNRTVSTASGGATAVAAVRPTSTMGGAAIAATTTTTTTSIGTDAVDLKPASRSAFVCTAERRAEDEEDRLRDIREYLRARATASAAAATATPPAPAERSTDGPVPQRHQTEERRWPEPPTEVAERIAELAVAEAASAPPRPPRVVASFAGGVQDLSAGTPVEAGAEPEVREQHSLANGHSTHKQQQEVEEAAVTATASAVAATVAPSLDAGSVDEAAEGEDEGVDAAGAHRTFAACSTEGDEDLVAAPAPASVVDASREQGATLAAAGTTVMMMISARNSGAAAALAATVAAAPAVSKGANGLAGVQVADSANAASGTAARLGDDPQDTTARPRSLELPTPSPSTSGAAVPATASAPAAVPAAAPRHLVTSPTATAVVSPVAPPHSAKSAKAAPASSSGALAPTAPAAAAAVPAAAAPTAKSAAAGGPKDLCRLPAWLPSSSCFTLLVTTPGNLSTREAGAVLSWLLAAAAAPRGADRGAASYGPSSRSDPALPSAGTLPAFSVVGVRLLGVTPAWALLPSAAAEHLRRSGGAGAAAAADVGSSSTSSGGGGSGGGSRGEVRVLAVACVPRPGIDPDTYSHKLTEEAAADAEVAATVAQRMAAALTGLAWQAVLPATPGLLDAGQSRQPPGGDPARPGPTCTLAGWVTCHPGAEPLFSPVRLPPHVFSLYQPRVSGLGAAGPGPTSPSGPPEASSRFSNNTAATLACVLARGSLRRPELLAGLLSRAAQTGLTLVGLQVVYATEEAAAAVVASTPHRPVAYTGAAVLALSGRNEPLRRWQAQLGPPDPRLAARTDPGSLHALYGEVARHITCSYDSATGAREVSAFFMGVAGSAGGDLQSAPPSSPTSAQPLRSPKAGRSAHAAAAAGQDKAVALGEDLAATVSALVAPGVSQSSWLALPAVGAAQQALSLWAVQHLLSCGFSLHGLLLTALPAGALLGLQQHQHGAGATQSPHPLLGAPSLVLQLSKEEAAEELPLMLTYLPRPPSATSQPPQSPLDNPQPPPLELPSLLPPDVLAAHLQPSDVQSLPLPYVAEQLLTAVAAEAAASGGGEAASSAMGARGAQALGVQQPQHPHGEDGLVVVAMQARPLHAAALLLAALALHVTPAAPGGHLGGHGSSPREHVAPDGLELVACRYLGRQVPSDVANCLTLLHHPHSVAGASGSGSAAGTGGLRLPQRLVISQPALIAVFSGPAAQSRVVDLLTSALQRFAGPTSSAVTAASASWAAAVDGCLRSYPTVTGAPLTAVTSSQAGAKCALAHAFGPAQVFLDPSVHDGVHRPALPDTPGPQAPLSAAAIMAAAAAVAAATAASSALGRLLAGPELLPAVVAVDFAAVQRNLLPRLLKQLWREGYTLHAASTRVLRPDGAAAAAMPSLAGRPAVLLHVSRSNAVLHLRSLAAGLAAVGAPVAAGAAAGGGGSSPGGIFTCDTWRDATAVLAEVWPPAGGEAPSGSLAAADSSAGAAGWSGGGVMCAGPGVPPRRFVRPEGSRLLQLTTMVVTPSASGSDAAVPCLDWPRLADALEALHAEGFRLAALRAAAVTPRDLSDLARASCRISPAQQHAIHASASAPLSAVAASAGSGAPAASIAASGIRGPLGPPSNLALVAMARDNAVTSLQILVDEAARAANAARPGPGASAGGAAGASRMLAAGVPLPAAAAGSLGRREAVTVMAAIAPCVSVSHSPAAAEQQIVAVFEGAYGTGGIPLIQ